MATITDIKLKRSATAGKIPLTAQLDLGEIAINTHDGKLYIKKDVGGTESIVLIGPASASDTVYSRYIYTATASQTIFTGLDDNSNTLAYDIGYADVYVNGVKLITGTDFTATNGSSIVMATGLAESDIVEIIVMGSGNMTNLIVTRGMNKFVYTATASQTTFSGADDNTETLAYAADQIQVYFNGALLDASDYTASNGTSIVLGTAADAGDIITVIALYTDDIDYIGDLDLTGNLTVSGNATIAGNLTFGNADTDTVEFAADVTSNILPDVDSTYTLGSNTQRWSDIYTDNVYVTDNVGIGTNSPSKNLHVYNATTDRPAVIESGDANSLLEFKDNSTTTPPAIGATSNNLIIQTGATNAERMRIDSSGNVGIGTSSPAAKLDVRGLLSANSSAITIGSAAGGVWGGLSYEASGGTYPVSVYGGHVAIRTGSSTYSSTTERVRIDSSGNVGIGTSSPTGTLELGDGTSPVDFVLHGPNNTALSSAIYFGDHNTDDAPGYYGISLIHNTTANRLDIANENENETTAGPLMSVMRSSGNVGIGTTSPQESLHTSGNIRFGDTAPAEIYTNSNELRLGVDRNNDNGASDITFYVDNSEKMRIDSSGNVGIGTSSPISRLEVNQSHGSNITIYNPTNYGTSPGASPSSRNDHGISWYGNLGTQFGSSATFGEVNYVKSVLENTGTGSSAGNGQYALTFGTTSVGPGFSPVQERMRITSTGNLKFSATTMGISMDTSDSSDNKRIIISGGGAAGSTGRGGWTVWHGNEYASNAGSVQTYLGNVSGSYISWGLGSGSEAMRIDNSGNLFVGTTTLSYSTAGARIRPSGQIASTISNGSSLALNRLSSDGSIIDFSKDGTTVGSIGSRSSGLYLEKTNTKIVIYDDGTTNAIFPESGSDPTDLGINILPFRRLYLSGGVYLGGTGAANKLDDYEEGTWTPEFQYATNPVYTIQQGIYRKIGTLVYIEWIITVSSHDNSDASRIHINLPFAATANDDVLVNINQYESNILPRSSTVTTPGSGGQIVNLLNINFADGGTGLLGYSNTNSSGTFRGAATYISST